MLWKKCSCIRHLDVLECGMGQRSRQESRARQSNRCTCRVDQYVEERPLGRLSAKRESAQAKGSDFRLPHDWRCHTVKTGDGKIGIAPDLGRADPPMAGISPNTFHSRLQIARTDWAG